MVETSCVMMSNLVEAKTLLNTDGRKLGRQFPSMGQERVAYCLSKLKVLRVISHNALGVKAGFIMRRRERN